MKNLYKVLYDKIEKFANLKNLNNFIEKNEQLIYNCDQCNRTFNTLRPANIMMYELEFFDNNILHHTVDILKVDIADYLLLTNLNLRTCRYKQINQSFCCFCSAIINKQSSNFNYCDYGLCNYISQKHYNFIKLNNCFFTQDYITESSAIIKRYNYNFRKDEKRLSISSIYLDNKKNIIKDLITKEKYKEIKIIFEKMFNINLFYLDKYLKEKCN